MKASKLIKELENVINQSGDLEVTDFYQNNSSFVIPFHRGEKTSLNLNFLPKYIFQYYKNIDGQGNNIIILLDNFENRIVDNNDNKGEIGACIGEFNTIADLSYFLNIIRIKYKKDFIFNKNEEFNFIPNRKFNFISLGKNIPEEEIRRVYKQLEMSKGEYNEDQLFNL